METAKAETVPEYIHILSLSVDALDHGSAMIVEDNKEQSWLVIREGKFIKLYIKK